MRSKNSKTMLSFAVAVIMFASIFGAMIPTGSPAPSSSAPMLGAIPTLTAGGVNPASGDTTTTFTYSVTYTDADDDAPTESSVYIDDVAYSMTTSDTTYTDGSVFTYSTTLSVGDHNYYFSFNDSTDSVRYPPAGEYLEPKVTPVNRVPTLTSGDVNPASGDPTTTFTYSVTYTDADDDAPTVHSVSVDGVAYSMTTSDTTYTDGSVFTYTTTLSAGSHNYYFSFDDGQGHAVRLPTSETYSGPAVSIPNQTPTLSSGSVNPTSGDPTTTFTYSVTYTDADDDAPMVHSVSIDGVEHSMTTSDTTYTDGSVFTYTTTLSAGSHNYYFSFDDGNGHAVRLPTSETSSGPAVSSPNNPPYTPSSPHPADGATGQSITVDLSWTGGDPDTGDTVDYDVYFGTSASPLFVTTMSDTSYDPGVLSDGKKYYWKIVATDNRGAPTSGPVWDFTTVADTAPPDTWITAGPSAGETITYNDVTFRWTGSDDVTATSDLVYRYKLADGWSDWTPTTSVVYIDLSNGAYTFTVEAKDQAGKVDPTPATRSFTVSVDTTRPETAITAGPSGTIEYNEVTFTWTGTDDRTDTSDLVYQYKYKTSDAWPETWTSGTSVTKVLSNGAYTFMVRAKDEAGNIDATPATRSFTVSVDTTPPETAITAGPSGTIDYNEVTFTWTGADDVTATANLTYQYTLSDTWLEEWIDGTNVTYTDLPNGDYTFRVRARDEAGSIDPTPAMRSFTVFVDTTPPETNITAGPSGTIDDNNVTFEWTGTDDRTVPSNLKYQYTWNNTWPEEWTSGTSVTKELPNGAYTFRVRARDEAGNIDSTPATRSFVIPGTTPPETTIASGPSGTIDYNEVTFTWTGTDDVSAPSNLEYQYKLGDTWSGWVSDTSMTYTGLSNGDYTFMVRARDEAENEDQTPATRSFTVSVITRRGGGGGGGSSGPSLDSDGDGYFDTIELFMGTDPHDPNDYPGPAKTEATPTPSTTAKPLISTTTLQTIAALPQTVTPTVPPPGGTPTPSAAPSATPLPEKGGFSSLLRELEFGELLGCLLALAATWLVAVAILVLKIE